MKERRKFIRIKEQDAVSYTIIPNYKSECKMTKDLSLGGVRFIADHFIPVNSVIKMEIKLKHIPKAINAILKLVWIQSIFNDECYDVGAEFLDINKKDLEFMYHYLDRES